MPRLFPPSSNAAARCERQESVLPYFRRGMPPEKSPETNAPAGRRWPAFAAQIPEPPQM